MLERRRLAGPARRLVVVISDFIGTGDWERPLIRLAHRNEVVALRVVDAADDALPEVGLIVVEDAETGEQVLVDSGDPLVPRPVPRRGRRARGRAAAGMRRAGVPLHRVDTGSDLVETLVASSPDPTPFDKLRDVGRAQVNAGRHPGLLLRSARR